MLRAIPLALATLGLFGATGVAAQGAPQGLNYRLGLGLDHSDNMARRPVAVADTALTPSLGFAWVHEGASGEFEAAGNLAYRHYLRGSFDDEWLGQVGASGRWVIAPERLSWAFQAVLTDQPLNPFSVDAPDNRQRAEVVLTGPTLALRPSPTTRLVGELRYLHTGADRSADFDGRRVGAAVRGLYELDALRTLSVELEGLEVDFQTASMASDYRRGNGFLRFTRRGPNSDLNLDAGYSRVRFERVMPGEAEEESLPFLRFRLAYRFSDLGQFEVDASRGFGDSAEDLLEGAPDPRDYALPVARLAFRNTTLSGDLFEQTGGRLGLSRRDESLYLRLDGQWRRQEYLRASGLDQTVRGLYVSASRQVRATFSLAAQAGAEWRRYEAVDRNDRDTRLALIGQWQTSRRSGLSLELSRGERQSSQAVQEYTDHRVFLAFTLVR